MIRKHDEFTVERRPCGGSEVDFEVRHFFNKDDTLGKMRLFSEIVFQPGDAIPIHAHVDNMEVFRILEGELVAVEDDGSEIPLKIGDYMVTGGGAKHSLRNDSGKTAKIMAIIVE